MNEQQRQIFKQALIDAVDAYLAKGGKIVSKQFYSYVMKKGDLLGCCPVACLAANIPNMPFEDALTEKLGFTVSLNEMWGFITGFDDCKGASLPCFDIGKELRYRYIKELQHDS